MSTHIDCLSTLLLLEVVVYAGCYVVDHRHNKNDYCSLKVLSGEELYTSRSHARRYKYYGVSGSCLVFDCCNDFFWINHPTVVTSTASNNYQYYDANACSPGISGVTIVISTYYSRSLLVLPDHRGRPDWIQLVLWNGVVSCPSWHSYSDVCPTHASTFGYASCSPGRKEPSPPSPPSSS
jgi:hypothetical protein